MGTRMGKGSGEMRSVTEKSYRRRAWYTTEEGKGYDICLYIYISV